MPRTAHPFDALVEHAAAILAQRLSSTISSPAASARGSANARRAHALRGKKLDMTCRVAGCKNRSGGPRWGFICEEHRAKLGKRAQQAAREAWKAKHAA